MLGLSGKDWLHYRAHNLVTALGLGGMKPVRILQGSDGFTLETEGHVLTVPAPLIWRSYRRGWSGRLARLGDEYGIPNVADVQAGETVIDIGANTGDFTTLAAGRGAKVFAFDGDPDVVRCLRANTAVFPSVVATEAILWNAQEEVTFYSAPGKADSSIFQPPGDSVTKGTALATTLDAQAERLGIGPVALLKMDAEGAEPEVLDGAEDVLARTTACAIDTGPERLGQKTDKEVTERLRAAGFTVWPHPSSKRQITFASRERHPNA